MMPYWEWFGAARAHTDRMNTSVVTIAKRFVRVCTHVRYERIQRGSEVRARDLCIAEMVMLMVYWVGTLSTLMIRAGWRSDNRLSRDSSSNIAIEGKNLFPHHTDRYCRRSYNDDISVLESLCTIHQLLIRP